MHGSRSKIPVKNLVMQRCTEGFNSGVKGLMMNKQEVDRYRLNVRHASKIKIRCGKP
jgi:hypothetical protein